MLEEQGIVTAVNGSSCWVEIAETAACGGCRQSCTVGDRAVGMRSLQASCEGQTLSRGDHVVVGLPERKLLKSAIICYLGPLFALFSGALAGTALLPSNRYGADVGAILGGLVGFAIFFLVTKLSGILNRLAPEPIIIRRLGG